MDVIGVWQLLAIIVPIIVAIVGAAWRLGVVLEDIRNEIKNVRSQLSYQDKKINGITSLVGRIVSLIHARTPLKEEELGEITRIYSAIIGGPEHASPLLPEEEQRLNFYLSKARSGKLFTPDEVEDYNQLVRKLEEERKGDPEVWPLVALGAFLFGLFLGSRREKKEEKKEE